MAFEEATVYAYQVTSCTDFIFSLVISPIAVVSLVVVGHRSLKSQQLVQTIPLLIIQLNTAIIWICMIVNRIQEFVLQINGH